MIPGTQCIYRYTEYVQFISDTELIVQSSINTMIVKGLLLAAHHHLQVIYQCTVNMWKTFDWLKYDV